MRHKSFNDVNRDGQAEDTEVQLGGGGGQMSRDTSSAKCGGGRKNK